VAGKYTPTATDPSNLALGPISTVLVSNNATITLSTYNFPVGTTQIRHTVTNSAGASAQQTVDITVVDTTKPVLTPVGNVTLTPTGKPATSRQVTWPISQVSKSCRGCQGQSKGKRSLRNPG
jgi:hypothetical protein